MFKIINFLNYFAISIPAILFAVSYLGPTPYIYAFIASLFTGIYQVFIALIWVITDFRNLYLWLYILITATYFLLNNTGYHPWLLPPMLALYFTIMLYKKAKKENHEPHNP